MANVGVFGSTPKSPMTDIVNEAGGVAYSRPAKEALAQIAATGTISNTFYATAENQLQAVEESALKCDSKFIAQLALYSRQSAYMKDMPALLCAILAARAGVEQGKKGNTAEQEAAAVEARMLLAKVFPQVIDNAKMLSNFVQIVRSGRLGRKSFGTAIRRMIRQWLEVQTPERIVWGSVGNTPSLADVIRLAHPRPADFTRKALHGYLLGHTALEESGDAKKTFNVNDLPENLKGYEAFKKGNRDGEVPSVPFQMLASCNISTAEWTAIAQRASWQMTRMNLNTFLRHGVFESAEMVKIVAERLRNAEAIAKAKVFPYQLLSAYVNTDAEVPHEIREALQDAMEVAIANVPKIDGQVYVCPDVSGSMRSSVTGTQGRKQPSKVQCIQVAALVSAAILRANGSAQVIPFSDSVVPCSLNPRDSVMTNATKLANLPSGGTNCSAPLAWLNSRNAIGNLVVFVSDNESWMDSSPAYSYSAWGRNSATQTMVEWDKFKKRNPEAKLVCIDVTPNTSRQTVNREEILNVGGFSDTVFDVIAGFMQAGTKDHWLKVIESIEI